MDPMWTLCGPYMGMKLGGEIWTRCGAYVDPTWTLYGPYVDPT